jgi:competence ComEA-like helix-hairpin-helix protein
MPLGARPVALGSAYVGLAADEQSVMWNPAGLAELNRFSAGSSYFRPYGMAELGYTGAALSFPTRWGGVGLGYIGHGDGQYAETSYLVGYGRAWRRWLQTGLTARAMRLSIENYGEANAWGIDAGLFAQLQDNVSVGLTAVNINAPTIGRSKEELPQILTIGAAYHIYEDLWLVADARQEIGQDLQLCAGMEYWPVDMLALRLGGHSAPDQFTAGFGLRGPGRLRALHFDYAFQTHQWLGATHHLSLSFHWERPTKPRPFDPNDTCLDLNTATLKDLDSLPGVGKRIAAEIVAYREKHGPFKSVDDLEKVPGLSPKKVDALRPSVCIK